MHTSYKIKIANLYNTVESIFLKIRPINIMLFICFVLSYPNYVGLIDHNLDPSWVFFLNYSFANDIVFGKDAFFTYGPLGWLVQPQNLGNNLIIGFIFWNFVWILFGYSLYVTGKLFVSSKENYIAAGIGFLAYIFCGIVSSDIFLVYIELMMLSLIIREQKVFIYPFIALYAILFLLKFSSFYILTSAILVYVFFSLLFKLNNKKTLALILSVFPICLISYLIYNPSLHDLIEYLEAAFHISMGMNNAMSTINTEGPEWTIIFVPFIAFGVIYYAFRIYKTDKKSALIYLTLVSSFFFFYKEGFVRHGGGFAFMSCSLIFSILLLNINWNQINPRFGRRHFSIFIIAVSTLCFIYPSNQYNVIHAKFQKLRHIVGPLKSAYKDKGANASHLPEDFVSKINGNTYSVFPWELSYAANTNGFVNMPVIQNYTAYTPWLDEKNKEFFCSPLKAPEYIVLDGYAIDGRWPFIETPRTFKSLLENYHVEKIEGNQVLLKKNKKSLNIYEPTFIKKEKIGLNYVDVPEETTFFSIKMRPSALGNIIKVLWKIPAVNLSVTYENGRERIGRLVTDNVDYPFPLEYLGTNPFLTRVEKTANTKIKKLRLSGKGVFLLDDSEITFYKGGTLPSLLSDLPQKSSQNLENIFLQKDTSSIKYDIEEFYPENTNYHIKGWALLLNEDKNSIDESYDLYVMTDKGLFNVTYCDRLDVLIKYKLRAINPQKIGFSAYVPSSSFYKLVFFKKNFNAALTLTINNE